jgi:superfamily I DNA/RNA helicase
VGMTRARQHLIFSVARMRRLWGDVAFRPPSRFLREAGLTVASAARGSAAGAATGVSAS